MREASRRLSQSLFDVYENDWAGEEDLGAIIEVGTKSAFCFCAKAAERLHHEGTRA